ncbi:MAG: response regulator [Rhodospirillales bacterium]|nr:response regulator [Rhodospirillales bacterium]
MVKKILVVDDEPDLELLVTQKFRRRIGAGEYAFLFASDGEEALARLESHPDVDVVLSDINMPRMDGLTLLTRLQDLSSMLRTVIISAYGDMKNIRTAMNRGAFDFITKPIDFDDLEATIAKTIADLDALRRANQLRIEAERARANLARYFSPNLANYLADHPKALDLGGERRELTFLFTDLADFTPFVERLDPSIVVTVMNEYMGELSRIVFAHGGTIHTLVGDAIHAMFGAPLEHADHAARAVACALELDAFARAFSESKKAEAVPIGHTRIGVHTGAAIVGNFGGDAFFHYTAYGDAVNTAARLETANKQLGTRVCVSGETVRLIPDFVGRPVGTLMLKGKERGIDAFEPLDSTASQSRGMVNYRQAFELLAAGDPNATQSFAACVGANSDDRLATFHLRRLLAGQTGPVIALTGA